MQEQGTSQKVQMYDGISFGYYLWQYVYGGCDVFVPKQSQKLTARLFLHGSTIGDQINDLPHSYVAITASQ